ncbi:MAG: Tm-1-like ATP-binding domain-containing protein [Planctomycetota bacterium]|jgi:uncharacterized protein (UPF0261 family)|nr:Tm-1-like ATP-binding domain-containing protein [Planctomycetota bacterium]
MKTIGIIASCDTKLKEVEFMRERLGRAGFSSLVIDISIGPGQPAGADVSREEVFLNAGLRWEEIRDRPKGDLMALVAPAAKATVLKLYREGRFDGMLSAGGIQNTSVAAAAMQALPIGFPTVLASTVASGERSFGSVAGDKDIVLIPSISDFTGINPVTRVILANACAAVAGIARHAGTPVRKGGKPVVGLTLMGVTNDGAAAAAGELERHGIETIGFHATGAGGRVMEQMAEDGILDGVLDLTTHEITAEYFGGGFSFGALKRLEKTARLGIPLVASTGGLDFIDFPVDNLPARMDERIYNLHNPLLAHIKILPDEAAEVGRIFANRLNLAKKGARLILPTEGMRKNTRPGGNLYAPETDRALLETIARNAGPNVRIERIEGNLDDAEWGVKAAHAMLDELRRRKAIG